MAKNNSTIVPWPEEPLIHERKLSKKQNLYFMIILLIGIMLCIVGLMILFTQPQTMIGVIIVLIGGFTFLITTLFIFEIARQNH